MPQSAQIPNASQPVVMKDPSGNLTFSTPWFRFFGALSNLVSNSSDSASTVAAGASPFTYDVSASGILIVSGGTVSLIEYGRNGAFTSLGITSGPVPVLEGDQVRITYTVVPTITLVPQ